MLTATKSKVDVVSSDVLALHLQDIIVEYESYRENCGRTERRESVAVPVEATLLDEEHQPIAAPFHMVSRDISVSGMGLFNSEHVVCGPVLLKFTSPVSRAQFSVIACIEHCSPCGVFFILGCRFLAT